MAEDFSKGASFTNGLPIWRELLGEADWQKTYEGLAPETKNLIAKPPLAVAWIPGWIAADIVDNIASRFGQRGLDIIERHGSLTLERDLKGIYKALMRVLTVDFAMAQASRMYGQYTRDAGTLSAERPRSNRLLCHYKDNPRINDGNAYYLSGAALGVLRVIGVKNPRTIERHLLHGQGIDVLIEWDE